jgi:hypothetical protein
MIGLYRKRPVQIEAIQFTGHNDDEIAAFVGNKGFDPIDNRPTWQIHTLEGVMTAEVGDYIIKGVAGEFYPCKPDIFWQTYEQIGEIVD